MSVLLSSGLTSHTIGHAPRHGCWFLVRRGLRGGASRCSLGRFFSPLSLRTFSLCKKRRIQKFAGSRMKSFTPLFHRGSLCPSQSPRFRQRSFGTRGDAHSGRQDTVQRFWTRIKLASLIFFQTPPSCRLTPLCAASGRVAVGSCCRTSVNVNVLRLPGASCRPVFSWLVVLNAAQ
jgi:hypothetical protein